jgi:hypothetical protein
MKEKKLALPDLKGFDFEYVESRLAERNKKVSATVGV